MPFIGNRPALSYIGFAKQDFTTSATTTYTLDYPVANENEIELFINNVRQEPTTAYTASGTTLTLTAATTVSDDMYAVFQGKAVQTITPPASSITNSMVASGAAIAYSKLNLSGSIVNADVNSSAAIAYSKLNLNSSIALTDLSATGTKNATTFLRGDNTFATVGAAAGQVIQVVSATKTDTASSSSSTFADITGLSVSITPSSTSNKILIIAYINLAHDYLIAKVGSRIMRDSTALAIGDTAGSRIRTSGYVYIDSENYAPINISVNYLDSPSTTSATTYKWQFSSLDNTGTVYVNRSDNDSNGTNQARTASGITVMEIAG